MSKVFLGAGPSLAGRGALSPLLGPSHGPLWGPGLWPFLWPCWASSLGPLLGPSLWPARIGPFPRALVRAMPWAFVGLSPPAVGPCWALPLALCQAFPSEPFRPATVPLLGSFLGPLCPGWPLPLGPWWAPLWDRLLALAFYKVIRKETE